MKEKERFSDFILRLSAILLINQNGGCTKYPSLTSEGGFSLLALPRQNPLSDFQKLRRNVLCIRHFVQSEDVKRLELLLEIK
jgi:hypothetical protein